MGDLRSSWLGNAWLTWNSKELTALRQEFDAYCVSIEALSNVSETESAKKVLRDLVEAALVRLVSIKTAMRAHESMNPQSSGLISVRTEIGKKAAFLTSLWRRLTQAESGESFASCASGEASCDSSLASDLIPTLSSIHRHIFSAFLIQAHNQYGQAQQLSYSQTLQILKSSDDSALRKSAWLASNVWCSQNRLLFMDLLNLTLAVKANSRCSPESLMQRAFREESIQPQTYLSMFQALEDAKVDARQSVTLRAKAQHQAKLPAFELFSVVPSQASRQDFGNYESTLRQITQSYAELDSDFVKFIDDIQKNQWVDARLHSKKVGGTWCENYPATKQVVIFANFSSGLAAAVQLAHPFAVGYLHYLHNHHGSFRPSTPYSVLETAAEVGMEQLLKFYAHQRSVDEKELLWYQLRSLSNKLLWLPMRHHLMKELLNHRINGPLGIAEISKCVKECWQHWFGDSVDGIDPYYWALKPHFFRTDVLYYDWQYTMGFLLGKKIVATLFESSPLQRGPLLQKFFVSLSRQSIETAAKDIFEWDLESVDFWHEAIAESLEPLGRFQSIWNLH